MVHMYSMLVDIALKMQEYLGESYPSKPRVAGHYGPHVQHACGHCA